MFSPTHASACPVLIPKQKILLKVTLKYRLKPTEQPNTGFSFKLEAANVASSLAL